MKTLERYITGNVRLRDELEYQFLTFRIITKASEITEYIENQIVQSKSVDHEVIRTQMQHVLGNFMVLAMHYVSAEKYQSELTNLITYDSDTPVNMELPGVLSAVNNIIGTASEIINIMSDKVENEFYVSQLTLDGIKQCYLLCELSGISILKLRKSIYNNRELLLRTTTKIMQDINAEEDSKYTVIDLLIGQGKYVGIKVTDGLIEKRSYQSGDIIRDFFTCTQDLRTQDKSYRYSSKLFEYFRSEDDIKQAYIFKGDLRLKASITDNDLKQYLGNEDQFERDFHHVLVSETISSMDDFLDYLYI